MGTQEKMTLSCYVLVPQEELTKYTYQELITWLQSHWEDQALQARAQEPEFIGIDTVGHKRATKVGLNPESHERAFYVFGKAYPPNEK